MRTRMLIQKRPRNRGILSGGARRRAQSCWNASAGPGEGQNQVDLARVRRAPVSRAFPPGSLARERIGDQPHTRLAVNESCHDRDDALCSFVQQFERAARLEHQIQSISALTTHRDASAASSADGRATLLFGMVHTTVGGSFCYGAPLDLPGLCRCSQGHYARRQRD